MTVPQYLALVGALCAIASLIWTITSGQRAGATELQGAAIREAEHLRLRIAEVRAERDRIAEELEAEKTRVHRRLARIVQLEERVKHQEDQIRVLRRELARCMQQGDQPLPEGEGTDAPA